jgi:hypothetical protein
LSCLTNISVFSLISILSLSSEVVSSTSPPLSVLDCNSLFMLFSFVEGEIQSAYGQCWIMCSGVIRGVTCGACYSPVHSAGLHSSFGTGQGEGEMVRHFSQHGMS